MGLLGSIVGQSKLKAANKKLKAARETEDKVEAEALLSAAIAAYATIESNSSAFTGALYGWGAALLYSARLKDGAIEAKALYEEAAKKFSYCLVAKEDYLAAALDWGVALMELTAFQEEADRPATYAQAKEKFSIADSIQTGVASYNFACLHAVEGDFDACKLALELARDYKNLPDEAEIMQDVDMQVVKTQPWFDDFIASINAPEEVPLEQDDAEATEAQTEYSKTKVLTDGFEVEYDKKSN